MKKFNRKFFKEAVSLLALVTVLLAARASIADHYVVPTSSMNPTVKVNDRLVVNKMAYGLRVPLTEIYISQFEGPVHGDVVVLNSPKDSTVLLKRIVACPGDEVRVKSGRLVINREDIPIEGSQAGLMESLLGKQHPISLSFGGGPDFGPVEVPTNKYLVMGDNRGQSFDGRSFGYVDRNSILGKAVGVYFSKRSLVWREL